MRKNYIAGKWVDAKETIEVLHPYDYTVYDEVPSATEQDVDNAITAAVKGARQCVQMGAHKRYEAMLRAATMLEERIEAFAEAIMMENGKPLTEARGEAMRCVDIVRLSAFEGAMLRGEQMPFESAANGAGKMGMTMRVPCGIIAAITPFNFPLMLALHKIAPAIATGNAVILKPASVTPISAVMLTEIFHQAGFEGNILQLLTGSGATVGAALARDPRPRKISFTGSMEVGLKLTASAGLKKMSLELGSNCPMIVLPDADMATVAKLVAISGYANAGQVCISLQRAIVDKSVYDDFLDASAEAIKNNIVVGNPKDAGTTLAAMIEEREAKRVEEWINEATSAGARVVTGGERERALVQPTLVADVTPDMQLSRGEVFGPVVGVTPIEGIEQAIHLANDSEFGLAASIFTKDVNNAMRFVREAEAGNVHVNWSPQWRADFMPYGGLKGSGIGKEGMRYACQEMTEEKTIVFHSS